MARAAELSGLGKISDPTVIVGSFCFGDLMDAWAPERARSYEPITEGRRSWPRAMRRILDSSFPPAENQPKQAPSFKEADIFAAARVRESLRGVGGIPRPRQEAADVSSGPLHDGRAACRRRHFSPHSGACRFAIGPARPVSQTSCRRRTQPARSAATALSTVRRGREGYRRLDRSWRNGRDAH